MHEDNIINIAPILGNFFHKFVEISAIIDRYSSVFTGSAAERYLAEVRGIAIFNGLTGTTAGGLAPYHFGYCPSYNYKNDARLIIPSTYPAITNPKFLTPAARRLVHNEQGFKARSILPNCSPQHKIMLNKGGHHFTYPGNWCEELDATGERYPTPCLVFEGEIDALTVKAIDPYGKAVSMGNAHRVKALVESVAMVRSLGVPVRPLWLIPDNDRNGIGNVAMMKLSALLTEYGFLHCWRGDKGAPVELDLLRGTDCKDINDFWLMDKKLAFKRYNDGVAVATDFTTPRMWK